MDSYLIFKTLHIISTTVLFGTGAGIAFFLLFSRFTPDIAAKFFAARSVVLADAIFTAPSAVLQPLTGIWLIWQGGYDWTEPWLLLTYVIYVMVGACWLRVVWIQLQLRTILGRCLKTGEAPPDRFHHLFRQWMILGCPAFAGLVIVFFLMVAKPT
jgi:uncharacterized membrane protein